MRQIDICLFLCVMYKYKNYGMIEVEETNMYEKGLKRFCRNTVLIIFAVIVALLTYSSMFINTYISVEEKATYVIDNPFKMIIYFLIVLGAMFLIRRFFKLSKKINSKKLFIVLSAITFFVLTIIIFTHNIAPQADQLEILNCAAALKRGDISPFLPNGYVGKCTNQAGIVMILYYLSFIFGDNNYQVYQFLNIFGLILSYYCMCKISIISFDNDEIEKWTVLFLFLFLPLTWYVTFVYGNIYGHAFSMLAVLSGYRFFEEMKVKDFIISFVSIALAMMFKSNYLIVFIAMVLFVLIDIIMNKHFQSIILLILLLPAYFASSMIPTMLVQNKTGIQLGKGTPMISYIEMGLQDTEGSPGWFNSYNWDVYTNNGNDSEKASEQVKNDLKDTLLYYLKNPTQFISFMYRKTISQWCNPDFQGTWILRNSDFYIHNDQYYEFFNIFESIVFLGTLAYIYYTGRHMPLHRLLLPMIFIGGFIFHMFWEAKCQYTVTYFVLLIPYCVKGLMDMTDEIADWILHMKKGEGFFKTIKNFWLMDTTKYLVGLTISTYVINLFVR